MTAERVSFRPSDGGKQGESVWLVEGVARTLEEVRTENRKAIEIMLHA